MESPEQPSRPRQGFAAQFLGRLAALEYLTLRMAVMTLADHPERHRLLDILREDARETAARTTDPHPEATRIALEEIERLCRMLEAALADRREGHTKTRL